MFDLCITFTVSKGGPTLGAITLHRSRKSRHSIYKWIGVQWSSLQNKLKKYNFGLHQISKLGIKFLQRPNRHLEPCLLHSCSMKLFCHHFLGIVCGRPFYGFRASRKCWRLVEPESGQTKRRRRPSSGTAAPTPPLPQITLLQSSLQFKQIHFAFGQIHFAIWYPQDHLNTRTQMCDGTGPDYMYSVLIHPWTTWLFERAPWGWAVIHHFIQMLPCAQQIYCFDWAI